MKSKTNKTITDLLKQAYAAELETILANEEEHRCLFEGFLKSLKKEDDSCCR